MICGVLVYIFYCRVNQCGLWQYQGGCRLIQQGRWVLRVDVLPRQSREIRQEREHQDKLCSRRLSGVGQKVYYLPRSPGKTSLVAGYPGKLPEYPEIRGARLISSRTKSLSSMFRNARLFIILFVLNFWRVCSQFWLSVRNSV